jgi:hypothetical protein
MERPEMAKALGALRLPPGLGAPTIPVGAAQKPVPTAAFPQLMAQLADQVIAEAAGLSSDAESEIAYMKNETGEYDGDPALGRDRSARLWNLLNEAQAERLLGELAATSIAGGESTAAYAEYAEAEAWNEAAYYDAMDLAEAEWLEAENEANSEQADWEYAHEY